MHIISSALMLLTDISVVEWSMNISSDSSPLNNTETVFSPDSSSVEGDAIVKIII